MVKIPKACPHCGCKEIEAQVLAWWTFQEGKPVCQGDGYIELAFAPAAQCSRCGKEVETIDA